ncbi:MAG: 3-keto-5-aminohexanoate cleavage protein [Pseudomonadota bacterium]
MSSPSQTESSASVLQSTARRTLPDVRFVAVAPNGGRRVHSDHPAVPLDPASLAQTAKACLDQGAAMIHLHVREPDGSHLLDKDAYDQAISAVKTACGDDILIQITTETLGKYPVEAQRQIVRDVRPEAASLAFREFVPSQDDGADADAFAALLTWMREAGALPQIILYDLPDLERLQGFCAAHDFTVESLNLLYVLGRYTKTPNGLKQVAELVSHPRLEPKSLMTCAFGPAELQSVTAAALFGADVRVGFENNLWTPDGSVAPDNAALVCAAAGSLSAMGFTLGSADTLRKLWQ